VSTAFGILRKLLSRKPGFWVFQLGGWIVFILIDFLQSPGQFKSDNVFTYWIASMLFGFLITLILRVIYKKIYQGKKNLYLIILVMSLSTLIGGACWFLLNRTVTKPILDTLVKGMEFQVVVPPVSDILTMTLMLGWPLFGWSILYFGIKLWMDLLNEKEKSEKSQLLAQQAQLQMLRYQLNPHFLFNSLNSIQALIYINQEQADKMLTDLSEFLRFSLANKDKIQIPLEEEIQMIRKYLSMEKTRFPRRMDYSIDVSEAAQKQEVISFLLQPFVENAIKHGFRNNPEYLKISIKGDVNGNELNLEVSNTGGWIEPENEMGTGMRNVIERLENVYPGKYRFSIQKDTDQVVVKINIILSDV
jgi:hypothetical protein